tara:strand:+ start:1321 stop:1692 length:372 start_codon:yes stop_codon:yes gene_type:complete
MYNPSTSRKYKAPVGRIAQVQKIQDYSKTFHIKPEDYISKNVKRNPQYAGRRKNEYGLAGNKEFPEVHRHVPELQDGKRKQIFKDEKIFEMDGKSNKVNKKKAGPKREKKILLKYDDRDFHKS